MNTYRVKYRAFDDLDKEVIVRTAGEEAARAYVERTTFELKEIFSIEEVEA